MAQHFAERLQSEESTTDLQVTHAFLLLTGRTPSDEELQSMTAYTTQHGLPALCRLLFNLSEFVFVD
jgi:hypothetical protein